MAQRRRQVWHTAWTTLLLVGCAYSSSKGGVVQGTSLTGYRYALLSPATPAQGDAIQALIQRGYKVISPDGYTRMADLEIPKGTVMLVSCAYAGHSASDALGSTGANVSCEAVDFVERILVYSGTGKHTGLSWDSDVGGAIRNALRALPATGQEGGVTMVADFPRRQGGSADARRDASARARSGTGFFVTDSGHIVTNAHVVDGCTSLRTGESRLEVIRIDRRNDLALVRGAVTGVGLALRDQPVRPGETAIALGFPLHGLLSSEPIVTTGIISALAGIGDDTRFLQTSAAVQPGNSGGPLLSEQGAVTGVVVAKLDAARIFDLTGDMPQNVNFALSPTVLRGFLDAAGIAYHSARPSAALPVAEITARARASVLPIRCN
jgi:S1-C subfamily serine protease